MQRTRALIPPQEDRDWPWDGIEYRWFRSPNATALEHYRRPTKDYAQMSDGDEAA